MNEFTQIEGEIKPYRQSVTNDTIVSATWTVDPEGPELTNIQTSQTDSTVLVYTPTPGFYLLECTLPLTSGAKAIGQARINVVQTTA